MKNIQTKFKISELASQAFYSCVHLENDRYFKNKPLDANKFLLVTNRESSFHVGKYLLKDYFNSNEYADATQKRIHLIDLDEYDHDYVAIRLCLTKKYKAISSHSFNHELIKYVSSDDAEIVKGGAMDAFVRKGFEDHYFNDDYFKFQEIKMEYRIRISVVKNRKVIKNIRVNMGYLTMIHTSKPFDYQETESEEKLATRASICNPIYKYKGNDYMAVFNQSNKRYKDYVEKIRNEKP